MKRFMIIITVLCISLAALYAVSAEQNPVPKVFSSGIYHNAASLELAVTNYGMIGKSVNQGLIFPPNSGINYLYQGSLWLGAKKFRRNSEGEKLYWLAQHPSADSSGTVTEAEPGWNASLSPVLDTLVSIGFDGDKDLYELLPAYNLLLAGYTMDSDLYETYNIHDTVLKSILSHPSPLPFAYPDPEGHYCFTIPQDVTGNEQGFETCTAYYYDFCPFGVPGDRDWGSSRASNRHYPLGLAIEQKSYAWPLQNYDRMVLFKYTLHNTSTVDTLYDLSIGAYIDSDAGPVSYGSMAANDDVSGYVMGSGYEFAYSRDADGDNGATPGLIACKLMIPGKLLNRSAYTWKVGDGPDDWSPLSLAIGTHNTANEKYWLMTGRNPNPGSATKYNPLRGGPAGDIPEYIESLPRDTRFLYALYGYPFRRDNPRPSEELNLAPGEALSVYMAVFLDNSLQALKEQAQRIDSFVNNALDWGITEGLTSIPYLTSAEQIGVGKVDLSWFSYTNPDLFELMYKPAEAPASQWQSITLPGSARTFAVSGLTNGTCFKFKVASIINPGGSEVYLESQPNELTIDDEPFLMQDSGYVLNYPNPANALDGSRFEFYAPAGTEVKLSIFNTRGRKIKTISNPDFSGPKASLTWWGRDDDGSLVPPGIYFYKLSVNGKTITRKLSLVR